MSARSRLRPCPLPWTVSPSGSFLRLLSEEEAGPTLVEATVNRLRDEVDELYPARVRLAFSAVLFAGVRAYGEAGRFEPERWFDVSALEEVQRALREEGRFPRWRRLGHCDWSGVYEAPSGELDGAPLGPTFRRFVLRGSEQWIEVVAKSCQWTFADGEGPDAQPSGEVRGQ